MSKYQEALENVKNYYIQSDHYDESEINILQKLVDKYNAIQEVYFKNVPMESADLNARKLQELYDFNSELIKENKKLKELVDDKKTPMKVLNKHKEYCFPSAYRLSGICPNCKKHVDESKYCSRCGLKLDWSDTDE